MFQEFLNFELGSYETQQEQRIQKKKKLRGETKTAGLPKYQSHHVSALGPRHWHLVTLGQGDEASRARLGAMPLPVLHVPPGLELLDRPDVIKTRYVIHQIEPFPSSTDLPLELKHLVASTILDGFDRTRVCIGEGIGAWDGRGAGRRRWEGVGGGLELYKGGEVGGEKVVGRVGEDEEKKNGEEKEGEG